MRMPFTQPGPLEHVLGWWFQGMLPGIASKGMTKQQWISGCFLLLVVGGGGSSSPQKSVGRVQKRSPHLQKGGGLKMGCKETPSNFFRKGSRTLIPHAQPQVCFVFSPHIR